MFERVLPISTTSCAATLNKFWQGQEEGTRLCVLVRFFESNLPAPPNKYAFVA